MSIWLDNAESFASCARTLGEIADEYESEGNTAQAAIYRDNAAWYARKAKQHHAKHEEQTSRERKAA